MAEFHLVTLVNGVSSQGIVSSDCQCGSLALLGRSGRLVVRDVDEDVELLRAQIRNAYKVSVHPSGMHVMVSAQDGDVHYFAVYDRHAVASLSLSKAVGEYVRGLPATAALTSYDASANVVGECIYWLPEIDAPGKGAAAAKRASRSSVAKDSSTSLRCIVGSKQGGMIALLRIRMKEKGAKIELEKVLRVVAFEVWQPVAGLAALMVGTTPLLLVSTATRLYRGFDDATGSSFDTLFCKLASGDATFDVYDAMASVGMIGDDDSSVTETTASKSKLECGSLSVFQPSLQGPPQSYAWASVAGIVHGLFARPLTSAQRKVAGEAVDEVERFVLEQAARDASGRAVPWLNEQLIDLTLVARTAAAGDEAAASLLLPPGPPLQVVLTGFHMVLRYAERCIVLNHPAGLTWHPVAFATSDALLTTSDTESRQTNDAAGCKAALFDDMAMQTVAARVRFDPFRPVGGARAAALRGVVRDVANRAVYVFGESELWELQIEHEARHQWRLFLSRALDESESLALRHRFFDAALQLVQCGGGNGATDISGDVVARREAVQFLRGKFLLDMGAVEHATTTLAECDGGFAEVYTLLQGLGNSRVLRTFAEKRYRRVLQQYQHEVAVRGNDSAGLARQLLHRQLAQLVQLVVVLRLDAIARAERSEQARAVTLAVQELDAFVDQAFDDLRPLLADAAFCVALRTLMEEQGRMDSAVRLALRVGQLHYAIGYHVSRGQDEQAIELLGKHCHGRGPMSSELWYTYAPVLLLRQPIALVTAILRLLSRDAHAGRLPTLEMERLLPCFARYEVAMNEEEGNTEHQVLVLLEQCIQHYDCVSRAVHNYYVLLLAQQNELDRLDDFLATSLYYDVGYALRVCLAHGRAAACVALYKRLHLYEDAIRAAFAASPPPSPELGWPALTEAENLLRGLGGTAGVSEAALRRLWMCVARCVMCDDSGTSTQNVLRVVEDAGGALLLEDVLVAVKDDVVLSQYKEAVCRSLERYSAAIADLQRRQKAAYETAEKVKQELGALRHQYGYITPSQRCPLCRKSLLSQSDTPFLLYPTCRHVVHEACAVARLRAMGGLDAFLTDECIPQHVLRGVRDLATLAQIDCVVCGEAVIVELDIPLCEEQDPSWRV